MSEGHDATVNQPDVAQCGEDIADSRCQLLVGKALSLAASVARPSQMAVGCRTLLHEYSSDGRWTVEGCW